MKQDKIREMLIEGNTLREAINAFYSCFNWDATKEGHDYWEKIVKRLEEIKDKAKELKR